jgi:2-haloacid dehalogenase
MIALPALVFDVNETLLDLESVAPVFERIFGEARVMREWFAQLILYAEVLTLTGGYRPFGELGGAVLRMVGQTHDVAIGEADISELREAIAGMKPHPEVAGALVRLQEAGFRLFTMTNNPRATAEAQLKAAGIADLFERRFSIDDGVQLYKPAPETYAAVAAEIGMPPARLCMIACHAWDTIGALAAGWEAALILRPGNAPLPLGAQPAIIGHDLDEVAAALMAHPAASQKTT